MAKIKISKKRYEALLDTETRVQVLLGKTKADKYISLVDMYRIWEMSLKPKKLKKKGTRWNGMRIKLLKIIVENFMCYAHEEFNFFDLTKIFAMNGKGKSSIAAAYKWCMFNCDYELKDNPVVRREVGGKSVDDMDTSVELTLDVDGKEITMKKVQKRTYSKDGSSYKDDNKYFINDVPKTLKDFNAYLGVDMNVFKMCSNVNAFLNQKPADMREYLFDLVEDVSDIDVARQQTELAELVPLLGKYAAEELLAMNKATKTKITKDLPILDGQIKEKERDIQIKSDIDTSDLELLKNSLKEQIAGCIAKQTDNDKLMAEYDKASADIINLKFELNDMSRKANEENFKQRRRIDDEIVDVKRKIDEISRSIKTANDEIEKANAVIGRYTLELQEARGTWTKLHEMQFDENEKFVRCADRSCRQTKLNCLLKTLNLKRLRHSKAKLKGATRLNFLWIQKENLLLN